MKPTYDLKRQQPSTYCNVRLDNYVVFIYFLIQRERS